MDRHKINKVDSKVVFHNYLLLIRLLKKKIIFKENKAKKIIKVPVIFLLITEFLDNESIYQLKYVCAIFFKHISNNIKLENKVLQIQIDRINDYYREVSIIINFNVNVTNITNVTNVNHVNFIDSPLK